MRHLHRMIWTSYLTALLLSACGSPQPGEDATPAEVGLNQLAQAASSSGYSLFGDASLTSPGNASATAVATTSNFTPPSTATSDDYGGIDFSVPSGLKFSQIENLGTDYNFTHNSCGGGSPRFQINVIDVDLIQKNAFVYIGPPPNYTGCTMGMWVSTGDLATPASFIDTSQLIGGTFYDTFAAADIKYGSYVVTGIQLVTDGGGAFADKVQSVLFDNVIINNTTYTFESAGSCKHDGWRLFTTAPGPFKNQGQCVSYFANGGK